MTLSGPYVLKTLKVYHVSRSRYIKGRPCLYIATSIYIATFLYRSCYIETDEQ